MSDEMPAWAREMQKQFTSQNEILLGHLVALEARINVLATRDDLSRLLADASERIERAAIQRDEKGLINLLGTSREEERLRSTEDQLNALTRIVMRLRTRLDDLEGKQQGH